MDDPMIRFIDQLRVVLLEDLQRRINTQNESPECSVCRDRYSQLGGPAGAAIQIHCGQLICRGCILSWIVHEHKDSCPMCRTRLFHSTRPGVRLLTNNEPLELPRNVIEGILEEIRRHPLQRQRSSSQEPAAIQETVQEAAIIQERAELEALDNLGRRGPLHPRYREMLTRFVIREGEALALRHRQRLQEQDRGQAPWQTGPPPRPGPILHVQPGLMIRVSPPPPQLYTPTPPPPRPSTTARPAPITGLGVRVGVNVGVNRSERHARLAESRVINARETPASSETAQQRSRRERRQRRERRAMLRDQL